jgi:hypothetical protein
MKYIELLKNLDFRMDTDAIIPEVDVKVETLSKIFIQYAASHAEQSQKLQEVLQFMEVDAEEDETYSSNPTAVKLLEDFGVTDGSIIFKIGRTAETAKEKISRAELDDRIMKCQIAIEYAKEALYALRHVDAQTNHQGRMTIPRDPQTDNFADHCDLNRLIVDKFMKEASRNALSEAPKDRHNDYVHSVGTQIIANAVKVHGYDFKG